MFDALHNLSHPCIRVTQHLITSHFFWPRMNSDIRHWACSCIQCQKAKIHCHTVTPFATFNTPDVQFDQVHIETSRTTTNIAGIHLFTYLCRPIYQMARSITNNRYLSLNSSTSFVRSCIARFGVPSTITTDRGSQFESSYGRS